MQSQRRKSGLNFTKTSSSSVKLPLKQSSQILKSSVSIQTDKFPIVEDGSTLSTMSVEEIKERYSNTLRFLNNCHDFINGVFCGKQDSAESLTPESSFDFRAPEVPNYFSVLEVFLERCKTPATTDSEHISKSDPNSKMNISSKGEEEDEQIVFDLKQFLPKSMSSSNKAQEMQGIEESEALKPKLYCPKSVEECNKKIPIEKQRSKSPSRLIRYERDISKKANGKDIRALSSTFKEILKTCNEFENKSIEYLIKNDVPLNEPPIFPQLVKEDNMKLENPESGDQEHTDEKPHEFPKGIKRLTMQQTEQNRLNMQPQGFNLLEYALRGCKTTSESSNSTPSSPRLSSEPSLDTLSLIPNRDFFVNAASNIYSNFQVARQSRAILNQAQCRSPKKVNEMFKKISRESMKSDPESNEKFTRFIEYHDLVQGCEGSEKDLSSCESIILNDEEFQRRNLKVTTVWSRQKIANWKQINRKDDKSLNGYLESEPEDHPLKCNPLKLTEKDKSKANEKVLRTIGLFTEKGEIRPGVMNILEEKQRQNLMNNKAKNLKFRTERKFDLEVRFNNQNMTMADNTSEESFGSERNFVPPPQCMSGHRRSMSVSSSSTVSESDVVNGSALIKRFN